MLAAPRKKVDFSASLERERGGAAGFLRSRRSSRRGRSGDSLRGRFLPSEISSPPNSSLRSCTTSSQGRAPTLCPDGFHGGRDDDAQGGSLICGVVEGREGEGGG